MTHMTEPVQAEPVQAPLLLRVRDVATLLGIGERTVYDLIYAKELEVKRVGRPGSKNKALRVTRASIDAYLARI